MPGLGRLYVPDNRDKGYPMRGLFSAMHPEDVGVYYRYWWPQGWWGDQGARPHCVAYSWTHWLEDGPVTQRPKTAGAGPCVDPEVVYSEAQKVDMWEGEAYEGTSVRAGAKILQSFGFITNYYWASSLADVVMALLTKGPVVVGTDWYDGMFETDSEGFIHATGPASGGHAYLLNGVNIKRKVFRVKNSWGRSWGNNGHAWISFDDMAKLMDNYGEACLATEIEK